MVPGESMRFHDEGWMNILTSPVVFLGLPAVWVLGVFALVHHMMDKPAVKVKQYMQVYNVVQILVCGYMTWGLYPVVTIQNSFPYINIFGVNTEFDKAGEWFVFVHYLSKYLDWFDTLWIVLNKKRAQLSFLHVYHHGTIGAVWGMLLHAGVGSGTVRYGALVNSITHVIMYTHYFWTSLGLRNPFKKYITVWQITQFYSCIVHAFFVLFFERGDSQKYAWIQVLYQLTMVYLFSWKMAYVPDCVPNLCADKDETPITCVEFMSSCNPQDADEMTTQTQQPSPNKSDKTNQSSLSVQEKYKERYIVIRGEAYDITNFEHPGGAHMVDLGVGRDATIMFEFAHLRMEKAEGLLKTLPKYTPEQIKNIGYDLGESETWPTPSKSELYETLRKRVREEIIKPLGRDGKGYSTVRGVPISYYLPVILTWLACATWFVTNPSILSGICLGLSLCWVGTGIQHTANHGGLERDTKREYALGLLDDIAVGGSSICWRYHHNVSHHAYCNDVVKDVDAHSSFPVLRMDSSQKLAPYHRFQWIYGPILFCFLWISIQLADLQQLLAGAFYDVEFRGTKPIEIVWNVLLKVLHFWWIVVLPYQCHGLEVMLYPWMACFGCGGFVLASMFIVSHNVDETKLVETSPSVKACWAKQQILTSTSWGCKLGCFLSGGLNLQIEHHLFPCLPHHLYPEIQVIVKDECKKRGIHYAAYDTLFGNWIDHIKFLYRMGQDDAKKAN